MKATVFKEFNDFAIYGEKISLPVGTVLPVKSKKGSHFVTTEDGKLITRLFSDNFIKHFTLLDISSGNLAYKIAFAPRITPEGTRFTTHEFNYIKENFKFYLKPFEDVIVFNDFFFMADKEELKPLADFLNIKEE